MKKPLVTRKAVVVLVLFLVGAVALQKLVTSRKSFVEQHYGFSQQAIIEKFGQPFSKVVTTNDGGAPLMEFHYVSQSYLPAITHLGFRIAPKRHMYFVFSTNGEVVVAGN